MGVFSTTQANAYADKIKVVYQYLDEIRKVADRLTPVEDLTSFQTQISELHARLDLLVEASSLIVEMSPAGEAILTGTIFSIRALLGIEDIPDDLVTQAELDAAIAAAGLGNGSGLGGIQDSISEINLLIDQLDQYRVAQQSTIEGLQLSYQNVAAGLETNQTNISSALQRLTVQEQYAALVDQRFDSISQELTSTTQGLQGANNIISGHTASISTALNSINIQSQSIDALSSSFNNLQTGQGAISTAIDEMNTSIQGLGDDIIAQSNRTTSLKSAIGGSANLLPNADFAVEANGWQIVVAQEDWANTLLTTNTFNMPEEVNCLEVLGEPSPLGQIVVESPAVLLEAGNHYIISGYPCVDNGTVELSYKAFNNAGEVVGQGVCPATFNVTTNTNFSAYTRTWLKFLSPAGATKLRLYLTVAGDGDWIVQGALFRPMVEKAWIDQAGPSVWTPNIGGSAQVLAEAADTLTTEVETIGGLVTAQAGAITALNSTIAGKADASALNSLTTRVTNAEGVITSQASQITSLQSGVAGKASASAVQSLEARVTTTEAGLTTYFASYTLKLDVNGKISGFKSVNDGATSSFEVLADNFKVVSGGTTGLDLDKTRMDRRFGSMAAYEGDPFGADSLVMWIGPASIAKSAATKANGTFWISASGTTGGGSMIPTSGSVIYKTASSASQSAISATTASMSRTAGKAREIIATMATPGANGIRFANNGSGTTQFSVPFVVEVSRDGGAWTQVGSSGFCSGSITRDNSEPGSTSYSGGGSGSITVYDEASSGSSLQYRVREASILPAITGWGSALAHDVSVRVSEVSA